MAYLEVKVKVAPSRIYHAVVANHGGALFPDDYFADLYLDSNRGRPTIPARILATIMLLQSLEGLSDREAVDTFAFDLRWQGAAGCELGNLPLRVQPYWWDSGIVSEHLRDPGGSLKTRFQ